MGTTRGEGKEEVEGILCNDVMLYNEVTGVGGLLCARGEEEGEDESDDGVALLKVTLLVLKVMLLLLKVTLGVLLCRRGEDEADCGSDRDNEAEGEEEVALLVLLRRRGEDVGEGDVLTRGEKWKEKGGSFADAVSEEVLAVIRGDVLEGEDGKEPGLLLLPNKEGMVVLLYTRGEGEA